MSNSNQIWNEKRKSLVTFSFCLVLLTLLQVPAFSQWMGIPATPATPAPSPSPSATPKPYPRATPAKPKVYVPKDGIYIPKEKIVVVPYPAPTPPSSKKKVRNPSEAPAEKEIAVDPKVSISLCVTSGSLKVNGWDNNEIRAYVKGGSSLGFRVLQYNKQSKKVASVQVLGFDPNEYKNLDVDECLDGENIELDVPFDASVSIKSKQTDISVESIYKVRIDNLSGSVSLRDIRNGVDAKTFEGDITTESADGPVTLFASTGRILVFESNPVEMNDSFSVKTRSGAISLQKVGHTNLEVSSTTGSLSFTGALESGGQYSFNTTSGKIDLNLPRDTSCKLIATYGGNFDMLLPFKDIINNKQPGVQKVIALVGEGEATLNVTTFSGSILIKPIKK